MAKKATSADKSKPATKPAKAKSPAATDATSTASPAAALPPEQGMASSLPNPPHAGASGLVEGGESLHSPQSQPQGSSTSSPAVQPRRPLWPAPQGVETRRPGDAETLSSAETEPQPTMQDNAPSLSLSESPSPPVSASPPLEIVHPGKYLTPSGHHTREVKSRFYTPEPPDLGLR